MSLIQSETIKLKLALTALRWNNWKFIFMEQPKHGTYAVWAYPYVQLRIPKIFNLRTDPYETADYASNDYWGFINHHTWMVPAAMSPLQNFMATLKEFPRTQAPPDFDPNDALKTMVGAVANH